MSCYLETKTCVKCGSRLPYQRVDRQYCGSACKQKAYRDRKAAAAAAAAAAKGRRGRRQGKQA